MMNNEDRSTVERQENILKSLNEGKIYFQNLETISDHDYYNAFSFVDDLYKLFSKLPSNEVNFSTFDKEIYKISEGIGFSVIKKAHELSEDGKLNLKYFTDGYVIPRNNKINKITREIHLMQTTNTGVSVYIKNLSADIDELTRKINSEELLEKYAKKDSGEIEKIEVECAEAQGGKYFCNCPKAAEELKDEFNNHWGYLKEEKIFEADLVARKQASENLKPLREQLRLLNESKTNQIDQKSRIGAYLHSLDKQLKDLITSEYANDEDKKWIKNDFLPRQRMVEESALLHKSESSKNLKFFNPSPEPESNIPKNIGKENSGVGRFFKELFYKLQVRAGQGGKESTISQDRFYDEEINSL